MNNTRISFYMMNRKKQAVCLSFGDEKSFITETATRPLATNARKHLSEVSHSAWPSRNEMRPNEVALESRPVSFGQKCAFLTLFYHYAHWTSRWTVFERLIFFEIRDLGEAFLNIFGVEKEMCKTWFLEICFLNAAVKYANASDLQMFIIKMSCLCKLAV